MLNIFCWFLCGFDVSPVLSQHALFLDAEGNHNGSHSPLIVKWQSVSPGKVSQYPNKGGEVVPPGPTHAGNG